MLNTDYGPITSAGAMLLRRVIKSLMEKRGNLTVVMVFTSLSFGNFHHYFRFIMVVYCEFLFIYNIGTVPTREINSHFLFFVRTSLIP